MKLCYLFIALVISTLQLLAADEKDNIQYLYAVKSSSVVYSKDIQDGCLIGNTESGKDSIAFIVSRLPSKSIKGYVKNNAQIIAKYVVDNAWDGPRSKNYSELMILNSDPAKIESELPVDSEVIALNNKTKYMVLLKDSASNSLKLNTEQYYKLTPSIK